MRSYISIDEDGDVVMKDYWDESERQEQEQIAGFDDQLPNQAPSYQLIAIDTNDDVNLEAQHAGNNHGTSSSPISIPSSNDSNSNLATLISLFSSSQSSENANPKVDCRICLQPLENPVFTKPCDHVFCGECWGIWSRFCLGVKETRGGHGDGGETDDDSEREVDDDEDSVEYDSEDKEDNEAENGGNEEHEDQNGAGNGDGTVKCPKCRENVLWIEN